ncbi:hypothetical protein H6503_05295 [Candidatus Woesearchaeota archaeon]|nr:hypothetical protein [Candidatus Woesearchaeota archaeon]
MSNKEKKQELPDLLSIFNQPVMHRWIERDEDVDIDLQVQELLKVMNHPIPREHLGERMLQEIPEDRYIKVFDETSLANVILNTYTSYADLKRFMFKKVLQLTNFYYRPIDMMVNKYMNEMKTDNMHAVVALGLDPIFNPGSNIDGLKEMAKNRGLITPTSIATRLMTELVQKNEQFIQVCRVLDYATMSGNEFTKLAPEIFRTSNDPDEPEPRRQISRFTFGLLTHHLGYWHKPTADKHRLLYELSTLKYFDENPLKDVIEYDDARKDQVDITGEVVTELIKQYMRAEYMTSSVIADAHAMHKAQRDLAKEHEKQQSQRDRADDLETRLRQEKDKVTQLEGMLKKKSPKGLKKSDPKLLKEKEELERTVRYLSEKKAAYEATIGENETEISALRRELRLANQRTSDLSREIAMLTKKPQYQVVFYGEAERLRYQDAFTETVNNLIGYLSRDLSTSEPFRNSGRYNKGYAKLKEEFPQFDSFYKFRGAHWQRAIYTIEDNKAIILKILTHNEYDKYW